MPIVSIRIPQLGEGLQEALLVEFLKKPGEAVRRDEPIYEMETDKAVTEVESPYEGTLIEWVVEEDTVLAIGAEVARMEVAEGVAVEDAPAAHGTAAKTEAAAKPQAGKSPDSQPSTLDPRPSRNRQVPPRTRQYLKEQNLLDQAHLIPSKTGKLMPADVDDWIASQSGAKPQAGGDAGDDSTPYRDLPVAKRQQALNYRLLRGAQVCVPVTIIDEVDWTAIAAAHDALPAEKDRPNPFAMFLWCVVRAMAKHEKFRGSLSADGATLRIYERAHIGVAVALPDDQLVTAVVEEADALSWSEFAARLKQRIAAARDGEDQATAATTLSVSNMGSLGVRIGIPAVVAPAVATLALGEVYDRPVRDGEGFAFRKSAMITLTFDHRILNGAGGAEFLNELKSQVEGFRLPGS
ncbi:MAG: dihydrolipoamide acetyltransferase family protein [Planctomycetaceae bacterium]